MKVKCIKTSVSNSDKRVIGGEMGEYLKIGDIFSVYGIKFDNHTTYIYIFDEEHLIIVPLELFEVIDDKVSNIWKVKVQSLEYGIVTLRPALFDEENFWENFTEYEQVERDKFQLLRKVIEQ